MKDKITIPNPLFFLMNLTPWTKRIIIIVVGVVIITAMITGNFDALVDIFTALEGKE